MRSTPEVERVYGGLDATAVESDLARAALKLRTLKDKKRKKKGRSQKSPGEAGEEGDSMKGIHELEAQLEGPLKHPSHALSSCTSRTRISQ